MVSMVAGRIEWRRWWSVSRWGYKWGLGWRGLKSISMKPHHITNKWLRSSQRTNCPPGFTYLFHFCSKSQKIRQETAQTKYRIGTTAALKYYYCYNFVWEHLIGKYSPFLNCTEFRFNSTKFTELYISIKLKICSTRRHLKSDYYI